MSKKKTVVNLVDEAPRIEEAPSPVHANTTPELAAIGHIPGTTTFELEKLLPGVVDVGPVVDGKVKTWVGEKENRLPELEEVASKFEALITFAFNDAMAQDEAGKGKHDPMLARRKADQASMARNALKTAVTNLRDSLLD